MNTQKDFISSIKKQKSIVGYLFIIILIVQFALFSYLKNYDTCAKNILSQSKKVDYELQESIVNNEVRPQIRRMLESIREGWVVYLQHNNMELLVKDENGDYVFSNECGEKIVFHDNDMVKIKRPDKYYDIYDKVTNKLLKAKVRPEWNTDNVKQILNTIASPIRAFGSTGDVMIFDTNTGEIIIDNSENCKNSPQVLGKDHRRYITLDHKHPNNKNPKMTKNIVNNHFLWKTDSDNTTKMVYMFNEPTEMDDPNNFEKYPLGQYNREFQEKIVLPYQTVGVDGQDMQITIVLGAQEKEIYDSYSMVLNKYRGLYNNSYKNSMRLVYVPTISVLISLFVMMLTFFVLKINAYLCEQKIKKITKE